MGYAAGQGRRAAAEQQVDDEDLVARLLDHAASAWRERDPVTALEFAGFAVTAIGRRLLEGGRNGTP